MSVNNIQTNIQSFGHTTSTAVPSLSLLRSSFFPSAEESYSISHAIKDTQSEIAALDDDVLHLQELLTELKAKRSKLQFYLDCQQSLISPIRRLPTEILSTIFLHALSGSPIYICQGNEIAWDLAQVCTRWRDISLSCSQLWSNLHIDADDCYTKTFSLKKSASTLRNYLLRSGNFPLSFTFIGNSERNPKMAPLLYEILVSHYYRWKDATFYETNFIQNMVQPKKQPELLILETLRLTQCDLHVDSPSNIFQNAPNLSQLQFMSETQNSVLSTILLPWKQLTSLYITLEHTPPANELFLLLSQTPKLAELHWKTPMITQEERTITFPVQLLHLWSLQLSCDAVEIADILNALMAPALRRLAIDSSKPFPDPAVLDTKLEGILNAVKLFVKRSSCTILELCISGTCTKFILLLLELVSPVRNLMLRQVALEDELRKVLSWHPESSNSIVSSIENLCLELVPQEPTLENLLLLLCAHRNSQTSQEGIINSSNASSLRTISGAILPTRSRNELKMTRPTEKLNKIRHLAKDLGIDCQLIG